MQEQRLQANWCWHHQRCVVQALPVGRLWLLMGKQARRSHSRSRRSSSDSGVWLHIHTIMHTRLGRQHLSPLFPHLAPCCPPPSFVPLSQLAGGVAAVVVRTVTFGDQVTTCFHLRDLEGEYSDFSYRKCLAAMFPGGGGGEWVAAWVECENLCV
jgi:hypothetical protein